MSTNKALILLQENTGVVPFDSSLPPVLQSQVRSVIDSLAETFEDVKTSLQAAGRYDVVHLLTDTACTRARLLTALINETRAGRVIDLVILGHGGPERLILNAAPHLTGGENGNIRSLLGDARRRRQPRFNLRLVYMCNCHGSTVNDDWLAIGAKVSVGSRQLNMMPEPMTTFFIHHWLAGDTAAAAAKKSYDETIPFYLPFYPPTSHITYKNVEVTYPCPTFANPLRTCKKTVSQPSGVSFTPNTYVQQSEPLVAGDRNCKF